MDHDDKNQMTEMIFEYARDRYGTTPEYLWKRYPKSAVLRCEKSGKWYGLIMDLKRKTLGLKDDPDSIVYILNIKCEPAAACFLPDRDGFLPAYHMNKRHWVSVLLDGTVPLDDIKALMDVSYGLVSK